VKLFSKNSKACDHSPLTLQTDRWTTYHDNTALRYALRGKNAIKLLKYIEKYCKFVIYFLSYKNLLNETESLFTQPPMRRMRMFYRCFFCFSFCFFPSATKYETTVLGNGWTDFHETFTKRYRGKWSFQRHTQMGARPPNNFLGLKTEQSEWRHLANVDDLRNLRYNSGAITRGRHARRVR